METQLKPTVNSDISILTAARIGSADIAPLVSECRACNSRDACLAELMMENRGQVELIRRSGQVFNKHDHIFREADESTALYVVKSGSVKSYLLTEDGEEQVLGFYLPGDVLGLDGLGEDGLGSSAVALEMTSVCRLPFAQLSDQGRGRGYPKLISDRLMRDHNMILLLAKKDANERMANFLCDLSRRFKRNGYSASAFNLSMSRQDIGSYLGIAIETVSRTFSRFMESGLVDVKGRNLEILDLESLEHIAGGKASN